MRLKILLCSILLWPPLLLAQFTQTQGTVTDPNGLPYSNGTITPTLVISASPQFLSSGFPYTPPNQPSALDNKGTFVMNLADVNQLTPSGGRWSFHVCSATGTVQPGSPITQGPVCFDVTGLVITGTVLDISSQLSAAAPRLTTVTGAGGSFPISCPSETAPCITTTSEPTNGFGFANIGGVPGTPAIYGVGGVIGPVLADWVNGVAVTTFPGTPAINFNDTTPAAPTNGRNVHWQQVIGNPADVSAALVGDGTTNCLNGQGNYIACINPTSGRMPLNVSGAFVDSPLSVASQTVTMNSPQLQFLVPNCGGGTPQLALSSAPGFGICIDADGSVGFTQNSTTQAFRVSTSGIIESYNNQGSVGTTNTAGQGVAWIPCATSQKSETGADASVLNCPIVAQAGTYRIHITVSASAASAATLGWTATWTDSNGNAQAPTNLSLFQVSTASPALTFTFNVATNYYGFVDIDVNNAGTPIVVKTTFSGTSIAYKVSATVERLI